MCPTSNLVSDFEDASVWLSLSDGMDTAIEDPTILLDQYHLPLDGCRALVTGIVAGTAIIVSDGSFNPESVIGPVQIGSNGVQIVFRNSSSCQLCACTIGPLTEITTIAICLGSRERSNRGDGSHGSSVLVLSLIHI